MAEPLPEPDCLPGAPHPRETRQVFGQDEAQQGFLAAWRQGRLHHAWLLTGQRGIGKATLAWKIARFLLAAEDDPVTADSLETDADSPLAHRLRNLAEPRLFLLRRGANERGSALSQFITVDETRALRSFLSLSAADGGYRVVIIDAIDEMNPAAANAVLKLLEEPPPKTVFLMISHQPAQLLPTIRSRCRILRLTRLSTENLARALRQAGGRIDAQDSAALSELAGGSVGEAFRLSNLDGISQYRDLVQTLSSLPDLDPAKAIALAEKANVDFDLILWLIDRFLSRLARSAANHPPANEAAQGEADLLARLAPHPSSARHWAELAQTLTPRIRQGRAVNLDPVALLMDTLLRIEATAREVATG